MQATHNNHKLVSASGPIAFIFVMKFADTKLSRQATSVERA